MNLAGRARSVPGMTVAFFDPWRAQARHAWRNRVARWRAERAQAAFHALALLALAALLLVPLAANVDGWGRALAAAWQRWPGPIALALFAGFAWRQAQAWTRVQRAQSGDWLAALPIAPVVRRSARWRALRNEAAAQLVLVAAAWSGAMIAAVRATHAGLAAANAPAASAGRRAAGSATVAGGTPPPASTVVDVLDPFAAQLDGLGDAGWALIAVVVAAAMTGPVLSRGLAAWRRARVALPVSSVIADRGAGRIWRWQRLACGVALHGRTLAWGALAWLLVPMDGGFGALFALGFAGVGAAWLSGAWRRSLGVLPQAQAWLASQPLAPGALLRAAAPVPFAVLALVVVVLAALAFAAGKPPVAVDEATTASVAMAQPSGLADPSPVAVDRASGAVARATLAWLAGGAVFAFGALQYAMTAALRRTPARIALAFTVQLALLLGVLQGFPLAAVPLWMVQMIVFLRKARA